MLTNNDGTRYSGESVAEELTRRFEERETPYLSDILGSDWGCAIQSDETLREAAFRVALHHYKDEGGHLDAGLREARERNYF